MALSTTIAKYGGLGGSLVGVTISTLLIAAIMLGSLNLLGGAGLKFREAFSVTSYSFLPSAISSVLALVVMLLKNPEDFDLQNPLPANLGAFLSTQTTPKWLIRPGGLLRSVHHLDHAADGARLLGRREEAEFRKVADAGADPLGRVRTDQGRGGGADGLSG